MSEIHLKNSPIREAITDFKFTFKEPVSLAALELAHAKLKKSYPTKEVMDMSSLFFDVSSANKPKFEHTKGKVGYRFMSSQRDYVVQFRIDGFTFSKLKPYTSWEEISLRVKEAYDVYLETTKADKVVRIATRVINFLELEPDEAVDVKKYFNVYTNIPSEIDLPIDSYLLRVSLKGFASGITSIINQGVVTEQSPQTQEKKRSLILDIDCFKEKISQEPNQSWDEVEAIKEQTNKIFFSSITEFTKQKYS